MIDEAAEIGDGDAAFLSDAEALEDGLRLGCAGVWRWKTGSDQLWWTRNLEQVHHLPTGSFDGSLSSFQRDLHPDDAEEVWLKIKKCLETNEPYRAVYRTAPRSNQGDIWIETAGGITTAPDGSRYLTGVCLDVSDRIRNEHELARRLAQHRAVARFGSFALGEDNLQNVLNEAVRVAAEVLHVPLTKILQFSDSADHLVLRAGIGWADGLIGHGIVGVDLASQAGFTLSANGPVIVKDLLTETRFNGPPLLLDHQVRSGVSVVIPGVETRPFGVFGIHARELRDFDDTDARFLLSLANIVAGAARQAAAAEHRMLLVREMAHRAGNMLQLVSSIASQTFTAESDTELARKSFSDRLTSLARANYVVARGGWTSTRFAELVEESLKPFGARIVTEGRDILLPPELCFDMGLVLHELATNSMKYGTLKEDHGTISIKWSVRPTSEKQRVFCFEWDDPFPSEISSTGTGFGSKMMTALVEHKWKGSIKIRGGANFRTTIEIPVAC